MWTVGPTWYAILLVAEALGQTGHARVADLNANAGNQYTPGYVIYEDNQPVRLVLLNYMSDTTGASDYTASVQTSASQVQVRYVATEHEVSSAKRTCAQVPDCAASQLEDKHHLRRAG